MFRGMLLLIRPKQWVKNLLVCVAPIAAGVIFEQTVWGDIAIALVAFILASSATYVLNDLLDVEKDRAHPTKKNRPLASRTVPEPVAIGLMCVAAVCALVLPVALSRPMLAVVVFAYLVMQVLYCFFLKHIALLDILCIASGFILRAGAGAAVSDLRLSQWFLLVTFFGSLLIAAGKRYSEFVKTSQGKSSKTRPVLGQYSDTYLRQITAVSAAVAITTYALWAFETSSESYPLLAPLSIIPAVFALLRYLLLVDRAQAEAPENVVLHDRQLQIFGLAWLALFMLNIYMG